MTRHQRLTIQNPILIRARLTQLPRTLMERRATACKVFKAMVRQVQATERQVQTTERQVQAMDRLLSVLITRIHHTALLRQAIIHQPL